MTNNSIQIRTWLAARRRVLFCAKLGAISMKNACEILICDKICRFEKEWLLQNDRSRKGYPHYGHNQVQEMAEKGRIPALLSRKNDGKSRKWHRVTRIIQRQNMERNGWGRTVVENANG